MMDAKSTVVRFPNVPTSTPGHCDVTIEGQTMRIVPDHTGHDGFRAYVLRRNERLGIEEAVEVPLPSRGALLEALTGLERGWRHRLDDHEGLPFEDDPASSI